MATKVNAKIIAVGNPGAGKSTLLNSLGGEVLFKSGLNIGGGLTYQLDEKKNKNGHFLDTPGLADESLRKEAGKAISEGLRMGGQFKVLFFVTEQRGRVVQQDATTIQLVHEAAPEIGDEYGIIVNMVSKGVLKKLNNSEMAKHDFLNTLFAGIPDANRCIYSNIFFVGKVDEPEDEDNVVVPPETITDANGLTFRKFIDDVVPEIFISEEKVEDINVEKFTEMTRKLEKMATEMKLKDETWKEERRQFEKKRIKDAEEHKKKTEELLEIERKNAEETRKDRDRLEAKLEEKSRKQTEETLKLLAELKASKEAEEITRKKAEEMTKLKVQEAEEKFRKETEEKVKLMFELKAKEEAKEKARKQNEEMARQMTELMASKEAEEKTRKQTEEEKSRKETEEKELKAKKEAEERASQMLQGKKK